MKKRWRIALIVLMALLGVFLLAAKKPWDEKLQKSTAKREAEDKVWKASDYATYYLWYAAAANFVIAGGLLASAGLWTRPMNGKIAKDTYKLEGNARRWFLIGVSAAVIVAAVYRVPRLGHSFWNDEEYAFRTYVFGEGFEAEDGLVHFKPVTWEVSLFQNKINNHIVCTVGARISHAVWKTFFAEEDEVFSEASVRILPLLCSLLSIAMLAFLLARIGAPVVGVAAAFFLALDPWHIRYSVEMRGYAYVLLFVTLSLIFLLRAMRTGRWRDWLAYAALEVLCLLSYPGIVFELFTQNVLTMGYLLYRKENIGPLIVANIFAAMATAQVFLPSLPQVKHYFESTDEHVGEVGFGWIRDWWSLAVDGVPWNSAPPELHMGTSLIEASIEHPETYWEVIAIVPLLSLIGLVFIGMRYRVVFLFVMSLLGGSALALMNAIRSNTVFHSWYVIYSVIAVAVLAVFGVDAISRLAKRRKLETLIALQVLFIAGYWLVSQDARHRIVHYDRHPIRQAVDTVRGESPAFSDKLGNILTASFGTSRGMIKSYDPHNAVVKSLDQFEVMVERSLNEDKPFYVYHCGYQVAQNVPADKAILDRIEKSGEFEQIDYIKGIEEMFSYHIYKFNPNRSRPPHPQLLPQNPPQ
jgi:hypothetical protein